MAANLEVNGERIMSHMNGTPMGRYYRPKLAEPGADSESDSPCCSTPCQHREFEQGDLEHCPLGWGINYCAMIDSPDGGLSAEHAMGGGHPDWCPLA